ncbi:hypothetical protein HanRHA438_Chr04g0175401 [Helianthus annuus]|uniref:Uncharacterized protein n=1 Tax=Helianthus annuus TaxID=4232 RepID=A0A9K3NRR5_HELAN|nr:hypothetical protein HanXRQr2_Chr04g0165731 [Helianthus annuus]KAJ0493816.1 hypothetical protein HanIR_Chr12g0590361 [Helianthus annuus]KAJ0588787.1 hypothetical protein HanIR_Chr04g0178721 [Helianthus annuus]KAJ0926795.1 hypothetical protein HanRHA438_Chr04g0175401 [Helianthus annuus]KAJ0931250.1 hypothetical protein HanPSC8_Chr04g0159411 [Helianthus annuus]
MWLIGSNTCILERRTRPNQLGQSILIIFLGSGLTHLVNTAMKSWSGGEQFTTKFPGAVSNRDFV